MSDTNNDECKHDDDDEEEDPPVPLQKILASIPDHFKYWMPAEWARHSGCLILYPHSPQTFRLESARREILELAKKIVQDGNENVYMLCHNEEQAQEVQSKVVEFNASGTNDQKIHVFVCPSNDTWARDTAPIFVQCTTTTKTEDDDDTNSNQTDPQRLIGLDWRFNAYGGPDGGACYWPCTLDRKIPTIVCQHLSSSSSANVPMLSPHCLQIPMILEGGSVHTDGEGTMITTQECLLNPNRNPHLSQDDIEHVLKKAFGVTKVIWLPDGVDADEDTNGHIDNFCCFARPGHVVLAWTDDHEHDVENYRRCRDAESVLQSITDAKGRNLTIWKLYLPSPPLFYTEEEAKSLALLEDGTYARQPNEKMAASYINFYIANEAVLVPQFGVEDTDRRALETLNGVFHPDRKVVGVPSREILLGGGNIHCQTQQVPSMDGSTP